jgi:TyrR family helix-turn-helix protein
MTQLKKLEQEIEKLENQNEKFKQKLEALQKKETLQGSIIAFSPTMVQVIKRVIQIAEFDSTVLIEGESGVGKEEVAKLIHQHSHRSDKQMVTINCSAIPETLLESELFGYEAGSFTGAIKGGKPGLFEMASGGTIFLDEIGEMPLHLQAKLLRVLQESEINRIGSSKPIPIDVRIVAATNRRLIDMVQNGEFREDLYYRLNIIPITIPPLRERREDIAPLVNHFLALIKERYGVNRYIELDAMEILQHFTWPGNVRQLKNMIERICLLASQPEITVKAVVQELDSIQVSHRTIQTRDSSPNKKEEEDVELHGTLKEIVAQFEKEVIKRALSKYPSIRKAALALGCNQSTLVRKIKKYQMRRYLLYEDE